jgi:hypothetical protein
MPSTSIPTNIQSPIYSILPHTSPPPPDTKKPQTPSSSLNIFAPKPFRSTPIDTQNNPEPV